MQYSKGMRYFITFTCYGAHLHGEEYGSIDIRHNLPGSRTLDTDQNAPKWRATQ